MSSGADMLLRKVLIPTNISIVELAGIDYAGLTEGTKMIQNDCSRNGLCIETAENEPVLGIIEMYGTLVNLEEPQTIWPYRTGRMSEARASPIDHILALAEDDPATFRRRKDQR